MSQAEIQSSEKKKGLDNELGWDMLTLQVVVDYVIWISGGQMVTSVWGSRRSLGVDLRIKEKLRV